MLLKALSNAKQSSSNLLRNPTITSINVLGSLLPVQFESGYELIMPEDPLPTLTVLIDFNVLNFQLQIFCNLLCFQERTTTEFLLFVSRHLNLIISIIKVLLR
mgnify:CR=1 FL=1